MGIRGGGVEDLCQTRDRAKEQVERRGFEGAMLGLSQSRFRDCGQWVMVYQPLEI